MLDIATLGRVAGPSYPAYTLAPAKTAPAEPRDLVELSGGKTAEAPTRSYRAAVPATLAMEAPEPAQALPVVASLPPAAFSPIWTRSETYSQDRIDLPFPYAGREGMQENNDLYWTVQGLQAQGAAGAAHGVLENWLDLGERYTALPGDNQLNELGRSGMPRLSSLLVEAAKTNPDPEFKSRSYAVLEGDYRNSWKDTYFKQSANGLNRFCDVDYSHDATLIESGGEKNRGRFGGDAALFNPVDLNAYLYQTEKDLATLAPDAAKSGWGGRRRKPQNFDAGEDVGPEAELFFDIDAKTGARSQKPCLAAFSLLEVGILDAQQDQAKIEALVKALPSLTDRASGLPTWEVGDQQPASPTDVMTVVRGLERYGYQEQAEGLKANLNKYLDGRPATLDPAVIGVRSALTDGVKAAPMQPAEWMSPGGQTRLQSLYPGGSTTAAQAGPVDRRLRQLHSSLLEPGLMASLAQRGLTESVYGLANGAQGVQIAERPPVKAESAGPIQLQGLIVNTNLGVKHAVLAPGVVELQAGSDRLLMVQDGDRLILGDRAYDSKSLGAELKLPQDILQSFDLAGQNPQLEKFFDHNREWLTPLQDGPASHVAMGGKNSWNKLFDTIGSNWKELTIDPSVVAKDTASQIFNRAAVPSLGIFKTQFNWDTLFMSEGMKLQGQDSTVAGMTDNLLYLLKDTGRVPNAARSVYLNKSQAPVLPSLVRMSTPIRQKEQGEVATERWLASAYDLMKSDYHDFWNRPGQRGIDQIDGKATRLSRHWGANDKFAMDESGYDTTSRLDGRALDIVGPDINAFVYQYSNDMGAIASQLADQAAAKGDKIAESRLRGEANTWKAESQARKRDVIKYCWDEKDGMFRDFSLKEGIQRDQDSLAPMIAPLWVGMLDPNDPKEKVMIERSLDNLSRFEKEHGLAATAEDYGHPEMQWNGPSGWAPLHMMALQALDRYGRYEDTARIGAKWIDCIDSAHQKDGHIMERYNVITGGMPPVQAGRYEETQGEGPGFGWTNASVAWTMVHILAGAKSDGNRLEVTPHLPKELEGQDVNVDFRSPEGADWKISQRYDSQAGTYRAAVDGDLSKGLLLTTPPLAKGLLPRLTGVRPESYTIRQLPAPDGKVQYRFDFEAQPGKLELAL